MNNRKIDRLTSNLSFNAFFFSILGWGLFEMLLFQQGAGIRPHFMVTLVGGIICAIALWRCRVWWPGFGSSGFRIGPSSHGSGIKDAFSFLVLAGIGALVGLSAKSGSCFIFMLCLAGLNLFPWSRISFCLRHFFISCAVLTLGAGGILMSGGASLEPFPYLFDAWALWAIAASTVLVTYRKPGTTVHRRAAYPDVCAHDR